MCAGKQARAEAQGRSQQGQCEHEQVCAPVSVQTAQDQRYNVQGPLGECVAVPLPSEIQAQPLPPEAKGAHLGVGGVWEGNSAGNGLGLRAHILWEGLSRGLLSWSC